jgi:hypothetical protein
MEKDNDIDKRRQDLRDKFQMEPPEDAWRSLDAELEKKQVLFDKQRGNRFKWLSIGLALVLMSIVVYYYVSTTYQSNLVADISKNNDTSVNNNKREVSSKPLAINNSEVRNASGRTVLNPVGGFRTQSSEHSSDVPGSLSVHEQNQEKTNTADATSGHMDIKGSNSYKQNIVSNDKKGKTRSDKTSSASKGTASFANVESSGKNYNEGNASVAAMTGISVKQITTEGLPEYSLANENSGINKAANDSILNKVESNPSHWLIDAFYSPNYYSRNHLVDKYPGYYAETSDYYNREKSEYSYATGLTLRYNLAPHWSISVGGVYSTIAYSITLPALYARYGADNQLHYQYPTSCGNIEIPNTSQATLHYRDSLVAPSECQQVIQFISIPLSTRFRIEKNRFTFFTDVGVSANFVIQAKANMDIGGTQYTIINHVNGLQEMNYGYLFGTGIAYNFYNGVSVFMEPSFKGAITSLTKNTLFDCYPYSLNINTGLSFHF